MHIADILSLRSVPAAGLFLTLTRRCPLACTHCSTNSMLASEQHAAAPFERLVDSFTVREHPEVVLFTGGEPLLRPALVASLARRCRAVGSATSLITGGFFARETGKIPNALWRALTAVDHVTFSLDVFHERQVLRQGVFAAVSTLLDAGQSVSFQLVGTGADDPYLREVTSDIRRSFRDAVPALVVRLGATGRAKNLMEPAPRGPSGPRSPGGCNADPCAMAAWPVVTFDGTVVACCNQDVVDGPAPGHLQLGHATAAGWPQIAERVRGDAVLRALRVVGPEYLVAADAGGPPGRGGYCAACHGISSRPAAVAKAGELTARPTFVAIEEQVQRIRATAGAHGFAEVHGIGTYADMVLLGYPGRSRACLS